MWVSIPNRTEGLGIIKWIISITEKSECGKSKPQFYKTLVYSISLLLNEEGWRETAFFKPYLVVVFISEHHILTQLETSQIMLMWVINRTGTKTWNQAIWRQWRKLTLLWLSEWFSSFHHASPLAILKLGKLTTIKVYSTLYICHGSLKACDLLSHLGTQAEIFSSISHQGNVRSGWKGARRLLGASAQQWRMTQWLVRGWWDWSKHIITFHFFP
jgi:hypothetical protein